MMTWIFFFKNEEKNNNKLAQYKHNGREPTYVSNAFMDMGLQCFFITMIDFWASWINHADQIQKREMLRIS